MRVWTDPEKTGPFSQRMKATERMSGKQNHQLPLAITLTPFYLPKSKALCEADWEKSYINQLGAWMPPSWEVHFHLFLLNSGTCTRVFFTFEDAAISLEHVTFSHSLFPLLAQYFWIKSVVSSLLLFSWNYFLWTKVLDLKSLGKVQEWHFFPKMSKFLHSNLSL